MGVGCTRSGDRLAASVGELPGGASPQFENNQDVKGAGVLFAVSRLPCSKAFLLFLSCPL